METGPPPGGSPWVIIYVYGNRQPPMHIQAQGGTSLGMIEHVKTPYNAY